MMALGVPMGSPGHAAASLSASASSRYGAALGNTRNGGSTLDAAYGTRSAARRTAAGEAIGQSYAAAGGGGGGYQASIFDGPDSAIELAGAKAAVQRLHGELSLAQQREQVCMYTEAVNWCGCRGERWGVEGAQVAVVRLWHIHSSFPISFRYPTSARCRPAMKRPICGSV